MKQFPFHIEIWKKSKKVYRLGLYERGLYLELIILAFKHNNDIEVDLDKWAITFNTSLKDLKKYLNALYKAKVIKVEDGNISIPSVQRHLNKLKRLEGEDTVDYQYLVDEFHSICVSLPTIRSLSESRKTHIRGRLKDFSPKKIVWAFKIAEASDFLSGRETQWKASFDWIFNASNFLKILEGNYRNKGEADVTKPQKGAPEGFEYFSVEVNGKDVIPDGWRKGKPYAKKFEVDIKLKRKYVNIKLEKVQTKAQ